MGPLTQTDLKAILEIGGQGNGARQDLCKAFKAWWQSQSTECDEQFMDTVFEAVFDEIFTLTRSDLPEDATLQYIVFER